MPDFEILEEKPVKSFRVMGSVDNGWNEHEGMPLNDDRQEPVAGSTLNAESLPTSLVHSRRAGLLRAFMFDQVSDCIVIVDANGGIEDVNASAAKQMRSTVEKLIGRNVFDFMWPELTAVRKAMLHEVSISKKMKSFIEQVGDRWLETAIEPLIDDASHVEALVLITRDVTERKNVEQMLLQAQRMDAVGRLTSGIAHDFNNLLTVIIADLTLIGSGKAAPGDIAELADSSLRAARRGAELTRRLLAFARRQVLRPSHIDVNELIRDMMIMFKRAIGAAISVDTELVSQSCWVEVDEGQLESALLNLAINSRDAMPIGGVLQIFTDIVVVDERFNEDVPDIEFGTYVRIKVVDTGIGMSPDVAAHAFEPFFTTKSMSGNSGMGLSMVYGFVKQSGGYTTVRSAPNQGTEVSIWLPFAERLDAPDYARSSEADAPEPQRRWSDIEILLVEDDAAVRAMIVRMLKSIGCRVNAVGDGRAGLKAVRAIKKLDIMISDLILPTGMNGLELAEHCLEVRENLPILFISGYWQPSSDDKIELIEGKNLLWKPFTREKLVTALDNMLTGAGK